MQLLQHLYLTIFLELRNAVKRLGVKVPPTEEFFHHTDRNGKVINEEEESGTEDKKEQKAQSVIYTFNTVIIDHYHINVLPAFL
jgi:hypothetical protein